MRKHFGGWLAALTVGFFVVAAPAQAQLVAGRDYTVIEPAQPTDTPSAIEVVEFFSYACPHCSDLNPMIHQWAAKLPSDVVFKRVPVSFNPFYELMARLFYSLETTGDLARLDEPLFNAIHVKGLKLINEKSITEWVTSQGVDALKFGDAWKSFNVNSKTKRADQMARNFRIQGVPAIAVDGRYLVGGKNLQELMALTDKVIDKRRSERNPKSNAPAGKSPAKPIPQK
jgi:protein dithiol oxidoreductase (disulfide-forming)